MSTQDATPAELPVHEEPRRCANCDTALQGEYCHACGQSVHNPVRRFSHALEEFFESFWHLDGRIFGTLRDLPFPGRVASRYLAGHRVGYVAPLRLFVVLSVLTFVLAELAMQAAIHSGTGSGTNVAVNSGLAQAATPAEVERIRGGLVADLQDSRDALPPGSVGWRALDMGIAQINEGARQRLAELGGATGAPAAAGAEPPPPAESLEGLVPGIDDRPIEFAWLPAFANHWLEGQAQRIRENLPRIRKDPDLLMHAYLGAVPKTLFVLVPLFALLLKVAYSGSARLYLEHLVVALYSHAWICLTVLVVSLLSIAGSWLVPVAGWTGPVFGGIGSVLLWALPLYLLLMQKLIYRESWGRTLLKYTALGSVYAFIAAGAALLLVLVSLANA